MLSIHWRMSRGLSVSHTSHWITRSTLLLPNQASKNNQPTHSLWLILVHQLRPSVMLKKTRQQETSFSDLGDHSHHCLHSFPDQWCMKKNFTGTIDNEEKNNNGFFLGEWKRIKELFFFLQFFPKNKTEDWQQKIKNSNIKKRSTSVKTWNKPGIRTTQGGKKKEIKHS